MNNFFKIDFNQDRIFGLDVLRFFAILFVVIGHGNYLLPNNVSKIIDYFIFDGVSLFFVLSGFLIGGILIKEIEKNDISFRLILNFWKRRWFRTLPNYFLILVFLCFINIFFSKDFDGIRSISSYYIFSQNLFSPHPGFFPEAWSLSVEEWFYFVTPIFILLLCNFFKLSKKSSLISTIILVIFICTMIRLYRYSCLSINSLSDWDKLLRKQVVTRMDCLMYGVTGAYFAYYYKSFWLKYKNILFYFGLLLIVIPNYFLVYYFDTMFYCVFSFSITSIGSLFLLPYLNDLKKGKNIIFVNVVTHISLISYSMYLVNLSTVKILIIDNISFYNLNANFILIIKYFLYWFLTIILSTLIYKYFEIPTTKLRDK